ncbi:MAG: DnaJ domain, conserved site [Acidimicrobiales bacterium]|nr:DnaJ domain, conserved site [Acidimicrobiales bacterium]
MTHYEVLGVGASAGADEIRRAYHAMARRHHPDLGEVRDTGTMQAINGAWAVLSDPARRRAYDAELGIGVPQPRPTGSADAAHIAFMHEPDRPPRPARTPGDHLVMVPVALLVLAAACFSFSLVSALKVFWVLAVVLLPVAGASFLVMPLFVLRRDRRLARLGR